MKHPLRASHSTLHSTLLTLLLVSLGACAPGSGPGGTVDAGDDDDGSSLLPPVTVSIDFEDRQDGDVVTDQYGPEVIFVADEGYRVEVLDYASQAGAGPHFVCIRPAGGGNCSSEGMTLELSASLTSLEFYVPPVSVQNDPGRMVFLDNDGEELGAQVTVEGTNVVDEPPAGTRAVWFADINDGAGIGWDDFVIVLQP